jgi:hypothetical protein
LKAAHFTDSNGSPGFGNGLTAQVWNESVLGSTLLASINLAWASEKEIILFVHSWLLGNFIITKVLPSLIERPSQRPYREVSQDALHNWRSVPRVSLLLKRVSPRRLPLLTESEPRDAKQTSDSRNRGNAGFRGELTQRASQHNPTLQECIQ